MTTIATRYLFRMMEKDFDEDVHTLTGLIDKDERPIVRSKYESECHWPIGFGRHDEWSLLDQSLTSPDSRSTS